ncbi:hypothetical protein PTTG_05236 [Puccinia triticina 1-1 BBBD Race 1]|uniref:Uncharacterized protein n=1 Tax=Puccinia triticina (isolate 1-1 / race 1 (BBBD)) TaxID=630390 RepID=A0A0C4EWP1_PUCT1|nr:hypothetical protein PTTG_05236 [Puccinia triticina 1-1 BBBD Race 1]
MDELSRLFKTFKQKIDQKIAAVPGKSSQNQGGRPPMATVEPAAEFKVRCGALHPWYPPAVSLQSFSGAYQSDPAGRKRHEDPKLYKAPSVPSSASKQLIRRAPSPKPQESQPMEAFQTRSFWGGYR